MAHVQISFLGKAVDKAYRTATYELPDGQMETTALFGEALARHLQPNRVHFFGTSGSMWDFFPDHWGLQEGEDGPDPQAVLEAATAERITQEDLERDLGPYVSRHLGLPAHLGLIPWGQDTEEQFGILHALAQCVESGDRLSLDVTHGFRHLPMMVITSALYLERVRNVTVEGIYYGALEMTPEGGATPVIDLSGLLRVGDWVEALAAYQASGDPSSFVGPVRRDLEEAGRESPNCDLLADGVFFERTGSPFRAAQPLSTFASQVDRSGLPGAGALFAENLAARLAWARKDRAFERQKELAWTYFKDQRDSLRAALLGFEAFVTQLVYRELEEGHPERYDHRRMARNSFEDRNKGEQGSSKDPEFHAFQGLRDLRNGLAHGTRCNFLENRQALEDPQRLNNRLYELFKSLGIRPDP
jgi:CRISPR-associated Csx2 family protein